MKYVPIWLVYFLWFPLNIFHLLSVFPALHLVHQQSIVVDRSLPAKAYTALHNPNATCYKTIATLGHQKSIAALHNPSATCYKTIATLGHHESTLHTNTLIHYQHYRIVHAQQLTSKDSAPQSRSSKHNSWGSALLILQQNIDPYHFFKSYPIAFGTFHSTLWACSVQFCPSRRGGRPFLVV